MTSGSLWRQRFAPFIPNPHGDTRGEDARFAPELAATELLRHHPLLAEGGRAKEAAERIGGRLGGSVTEVITRQ